MKVKFQHVFLIILMSCGSPTIEEKEVQSSSIETEIKKDKEVITNIMDTIVEEIDTIIVNEKTESLEIDKKEVVKNKIEEKPVNNSTAIEANQKEEVFQEVKDQNKEVAEEKIEPITPKEEVKENPKPEPYVHKTWDELLRKHVSSNGKVNYKGFKADKTQLDVYLNELEVQNSKLSSMSKAEKLAYWINVYNAYTVKLIVDNYPTSSITKLKGGKPWDAKFINLGGNSYSLDYIENGIIRKQFDEPRIHFSVNCASESCPKLLNQAFTASNLYRKLEQLTKEFINDNSKNQVAKKSAKLSKIFEWYKDDFTKSGTIIDFINKYANTPTTVSDDKITYMEYGWGLNE